MSGNFDEKSGIVQCLTSWGCWVQSLEEVSIQVNVPHGTSAKDIKCLISHSHISLSVAGKLIIKVCYYH